MASPPLYWKPQKLKTPAVDLSTALNVAANVMKASGLVEIKRATREVSGRTSDSHAAIGFVKSGNSYVAVIIAAGSGAKPVVIKLSAALDALVWQ